MTTPMAEWMAERDVSAPLPQRPPFARSGGPARPAPKPQSARHVVERRSGLSDSVALSRLMTIGLSELNERAALQTRIDRKYMLPAGEVDGLLAEIGVEGRVLEIDGRRSFAYESVYYDTPELTTYLLAAYRRRRRFKIRMRTYLDSSLCWLEVKVRGARGSTVKHRLPYDPASRNALDAGRQFVDNILAEQSIAGSGEMTFAPTLITRYRRSTLFVPSTSSRATIDTHLTWEDGGRQLCLPEIVIVETKTGSVPSCIDRMLWARGHRPIRVSKYATGLAALRPYLPAVPWRRTLRRHFASAGPPASPRNSWRPAG